MLSKVIVQCFAEKLTLEQLRLFMQTVLIPQDAMNLYEHALAAEKVIIEQNSGKQE